MEKLKSKHGRPPKHGVTRGSRITLKLLPETIDGLFEIADDIGESGCRGEAIIYLVREYMNHKYSDNTKQQGELG